MNTVRVFVTSIRAIVDLMEIVLVIRVFCELMAVPRKTKPFKFLLFISEPILSPIRTLLAKQSKDKNPRIDISPLVAMILLYLINMVLKNYI